MFESFSEPARRLVFLARFAAGRLKFNSIDVQHLVLGFILEDQGKADEWMHKGFGLESPPTSIKAPEATASFLDEPVASKLQEEFSYLGALQDPQPPHVNIGLSKEAQAVLAGAFEHAGGGSVTPLHLLWGVLADEGSPTAQCLLENGVTRQRVAAAISSQS